MFLYALLPIVRNTYTGIHEIGPAVRESAIGMGMNPRQLLKKVELPLAMPIIFAGIRTAFVINVGVATLCALIAAGGLGEFIFRGLSTNNPHMIMAGALPAALMALLFDWLMSKLEKRINQLIKPLLITSAVILLSVIGFQFWPNQESRLSAGFPSEFIERGDGYRGLQEVYNLDLDVNEMEIGLMYDAVKNNDVDVISGFSTDGRIKAFNLISLIDDKSYFPPYHAAPLVSGKIVNQHQDVVQSLNLLEGLISDTDMAEMNFQVDQQQKNFEEVARSFLKRKGFDLSKNQNGKDIVIGSKNFTESFILAYIFKLIIEAETSKSVDLKLGFGGTKLLFDALNTGAVDIYPEYTGTGLLVILKPDSTKKILYQKQEIYDYVKKEFIEHYNLHWLQPLGFNNTFALMMRKKEAERLGISSISDLRRY